MRNGQIADALDEVGDLLEFQGANTFRVRAYRQAARTIRDLKVAMSDLIDADDNQLTELPGIGKDLAAKCAELYHTGSLTMLDELRQQTPHGVLALMRIPGLGAKKAAALHKELGIMDLEQLKVACEKGRVAKLKGFGATTQKNILEGIAFAATAGKRLRWSEAEPIVYDILEHLRSGLPEVKAEPAGSFRRGKETIGDIDILVTGVAADQVMDHFAKFPGISQELARGPTKMSVRVAPELQVDLRVVPEESFGAALQYFTGSKEHNVVLRSRAKDRGLKVNEYGVYHAKEVESEAEAISQSVAGRTEADVYQAIGLPWIPPELREGRDEFTWADRGSLPKLIELADLRGDLHMHTTATDGQASITEMVQGARERGLKYVAITDHSRRVTMARGLDPDRLRAQWKEIDTLNAACEDEFLILKGIECDILEGGGMDLPDDVLVQADWVMASIHYGQSQSIQEITDRILGALKNEFVSAIAHPTGRLINRREPYAVDFLAVLQGAQEFGKCLELNANPWRLDLDDTMCAAAKARGIPIVINSDAHSVMGMDVLRFGIIQARRAGLEARDVFNTRPWQPAAKS
jgi:DNA polymerase (family X)